MFQLLPRQEEMLSRNGFVVIPSDAFDGMDDIYGRLAEGELPVLVTTDALLHTAHMFFDYLLRIVEITALRPQLAALTDALLKASAKDFVSAKDAAVRKAARRNMAFFAVAARLLDSEAATPPEVQEAVEAELELIKARETGNPPPKSPALGIREDYSQYVPRGHYTRNEDFRTYFLAAMWYGRMGFFLHPSESHDLSEADTVRLARQALLITRSLRQVKVPITPLAQEAGDWVAVLKAGKPKPQKRPALAVWRAIYETTALFAGRAEDLGPDEYAAAAQEVWGGLPTLRQLADDEKMAEFLQKARQLPRPRVLSTYYLSQQQADRVTPDWRDGTLGFRMLAQRFVPDTHIFSELVWDRVGKYTNGGEPFTLFVSTYDGPYRAFPRGLDVLAAFGSQLAERILRQEGDTEYEGYDEKLAALRAEYAKGKPDGDLYQRWLWVLRGLVEPAEDGAPAFMRKEPWERKQLNAALGSWAELRHDTILYIKQSYSSMARMAVMEPPERHAFVEPYPKVFHRLAAMIDHLRGQLGTWGMLDGSVAKKLRGYSELAENLAGIAERELQGQWPTQNERHVLFAIGSQLKNLLQFPHKLMQQITSSTDDKMAVVADVHTHLEGGQVLEEAVGDPFLICAELQNGGGRRRYWGAVFSHYEFKHPIKDRLTDEAWQAMAPKPPLPPWTGAFIAE